jgi:hypothetical protein
VELSFRWVIGCSDEIYQVRNWKHEGGRVRFFHMHRARKYVFDFISSHLFTRYPAIIKSGVEPTINYPHTQFFIPLTNNRLMETFIPQKGSGEFWSTWRGCENRFVLIS